MRKSKRFISVFFIIIFTSSISACQVDSIKSNARTLPLARKWFADNEVDLPLPFCVSVFLTHMSRVVDITNVDVAFIDQPKQSINEFTSFELNNKSTVSAIKLDAWLLPLW